MAVPIINIVCHDSAALKIQTLQLYNDQLGAEGNDSVALLLPSLLVASKARRRLLELTGHSLLDPRIYTFPQLAETLLIANRHPYRSLTPLQRELLLTDVLAKIGADNCPPLLAKMTHMPGVINATGQVISDLKHAVVDPEGFNSAARRYLPTHPANDAIYRAYSDYQKRLRELKLYDNPGMFWEALVSLKQGRKPFDNLKTLIVDGFTEFTLAQVQVLAELCAGIKQAHFQICYDPERPELFSLTSRTIQHFTQALQQRSPDAQVNWTSAPPKTKTATDEIRRTFRQQHPPPASEQVKDCLSILEVAGGPGAEAREVARRIKRLLVDGTRPDSVAIIMREYDNPRNDAFITALRGMGIPCTLHKGQPLEWIPAVRVVLDMLAVLTEDWQRDVVMQLLNNTYIDFKALSGHTRVTASELENVARDAGVMVGLSEWRRRLRAWRKQLASLKNIRLRLEREQGISNEDPRIRQRLTDEDGNLVQATSQLSHQQALARNCAVTIESLRQILQPLTNATSWKTAVTNLHQAMERLSIFQRVTQIHSDENLQTRDMLGLQTFMDGLGQFAAATSILQIDNQISFSDFATAIRKYCATTDIQLPDTPDGVQVISIRDARGMAYDHVFVPTLNEGIFPHSGSPDPFYDDDDRQTLSKSRLILEPRINPQKNEALLFYLILGMARKTLTLSSQTSDAEGSPLLYSSFLDEIKSWLGDRAEAITQEFSLTDLTCSITGAGSLRELEQAVFLQLGKQNLTSETRSQAQQFYQTLYQTNSEHTAHLVRLAGVELARTALHPTGKYIGNLTDRNIIESLNDDQKFGPGHRFSASQLGSYGRCPFNFFMQNVLHLQEPQEPVEGLTPLMEGELAHRVLSQFFINHRIELIAELHAENCKNELNELITAVFREGEAFAGHRKLWALSAERMKEDLGALLAFELKPATNKDFTERRVMMTEQAYGRDGEVEVVPNVLVQGRIDRIDNVIYKENQGFMVFDYKLSTGSNSSAITQGTDFQLPLYCIACEQMGWPAINPRCIGWAYIRIRRQNKWLAKVINTDDKDNTNTFIKDAKFNITRHVTGIRAGSFMPPESRGKHCTYCAFRSICRTPKIPRGGI